MREIFPCGKFVISFRDDVERHYRSVKKHWSWLRLSLTQLTARKNMLAEQFPAENPSFAYKMALENFTVAKYNHLLDWIGFKGCHYSTHACIPVFLLIFFFVTSRNCTLASVIKVAHTKPWKVSSLPRSIMAFLIAGTCVMPPQENKRNGGDSGSVTSGTYKPPLLLYLLSTG